MTYPTITAPHAAITVVLAVLWFWIIGFPQGITGWAGFATGLTIGSYIHMAFFKPDNHS